MILLALPLFVKTPDIPSTLNKDDSIKLECLIEGVPKPTINWYVNFIFFLDIFIKLTLFRIINGKELSTKDGVQIEKDVNNNKYSLIIPKLNPTLHAGTVTIKATNVVGIVTHDVNINIFGNFIFYFSKIFYL